MSDSQSPAPQSPAAQAGTVPEAPRQNKVLQEIFAGPVLTAVLAIVLSMIIGGILIAAGDPAGPFVLLGGIVAVFAFTMLEAWVLLIEILR